MHIYNWYHSDVTRIHYVHKYVTVNYRSIPLLFSFPSLRSLLLPIRLPLLTWNPPCCDRIRPPRSQVARKLIFPFPSPCSYTPYSKIPTPRGFPDPNIHSLGRHCESGSQDPAQFPRCRCSAMIIYASPAVLVSLSDSMYCSTTRGSCMFTIDRSRKCFLAW
jgi:hypothetical protein